MYMSTREKILRAALELFSRKPYSKVTVDEIARKAGVAKGTIFHYFKSKADLGEKVLDFFLEIFVARPLNKILSSSEPFEKKIERIVSLAVGFTLKHDIKAVLLLADIYEELRKLGKAWIIESFYGKYAEVFTKFFEENGVENPRVKAMLFMAVLDGLSFQAMISPKSIEENLDQIVGEVVAMLKR
ncbi:MAG: hypothetical protein DRJ52_05835 [Thermoprotei archaeon]|nr:MAG: hypothetical protein DRJ52_05835 [Thermoprotei archaeon]RLE98140.1 MAG: hypothetical protein DRJ63_08170 [Thermoprotei archaeon]